MVSKAHKNKIPTAMHIFSGMTFSIAIIFISPAVAITPEINISDKTLLTSQRCKTVIVCFKGCGRQKKLDKYC